MIDETKRDTTSDIEFGWISNAIAKLLVRASKQSKWSHLFSTYNFFLKNVMFLLDEHWKKVTKIVNKH